MWSAGFLQTATFHAKTEISHPSPQDLRPRKISLAPPAPATILLQSSLEQCAAVIAGFDSLLAGLPRYNDDGKV